MKEMQPYRRRIKLRRPSRERKRRNLRAARRLCVHRKINHHVIQALVEDQLLHRQIMAQPMAIRMAFARRVRSMLIRRRIAVVTAARIRGERRQRPVASTRVVHIVPATPKHRMDEQRITQQATKNGTHQFDSPWGSGHPVAGVLSLPALGIYLTQTFDKTGRQSTFNPPPRRHNPHFYRSIVFSGLSAARSIEVCPKSPTRRPSISAHSFQAVSKSCRYDRFFAA